MPHKVKGRLQRIERLDTGICSRGERVSCTLSHGRAESVLAHRTHVADHGELVRRALARLARSREAVSLITAHGHVVVFVLGSRPSIVTWLFQVEEVG